MCMCVCVIYDDYDDFVAEATYVVGVITDWLVMCGKYVHMCLCNI